jgi:hypothetical protein
MSFSENSAMPSQQRKRPGQAEQLKVVYTQKSDHANLRSLGYLSLSTFPKDTQIGITLYAIIKAHHKDTQTDIL